MQAARPRYNRSAWAQGPGGLHAHLSAAPLVDEIRELAEPLKGKRVLHVCATAFGGGVSEILYTLVPLMRDAGLDAEWQVIYGREEFFNATKLMHNALQGAPAGPLPRRSGRSVDRYNEMNARELDGGWDFIIIHDPQPAALHSLVPEKAARAGCGAATSTSRRPTPRRSRACCRSSSDYPQSVFHLQAYVPGGHGRQRSTSCPPAIDPLAPKNMALSPEDAAYVCDQFGVDVDRPLMCQVSRFDPWKDPLGVIDAYRIVKEEMPERAARAGRLDGDRRPRGLGLLQRARSRTPTAIRTSTSSTTSTTSARSRSTPSSRSPTCSSRSRTREGFGLTVSEALWKARPIIGGNVGGIPLQVEDGVSGFLVDNVEECAAPLARDPARPRAGQVARAARARSTCASSS